MASSTYLELTNKLLTQLNEVVLTTDNFESPRGVHAAAKDAIQFAINDINSHYFKWPFNLVLEQSKTLTAGTEIYAFETNYKVADWNSFYLYDDGTLNTTPRPLKLINRESFLLYSKPIDDEAGASGLGKPDFVFPYYGKFGVTKSPDAAYTIKYNYWQYPSQLSAHGDETTIPEQWDHVIVSGAMWFLNMFKENPDGVDRVEKIYKQYLNDMRTVLINEDRDFIDTRVNFGQRYASAYNRVV